jgi:DNA-binding NtrC family response regulator
MELLRLLRKRAPGVDVILMAAFDDLPLVASAMNGGAIDFLVKPLDLHQLRRLLERVYEDRSARSRRTPRKRSTPREGSMSPPPPMPDASSSPWRTTAPESHPRT